MRLIIFLLFWLIIFSLPDPGFCTQPPIDNSNQLEPIFQQLFSAPKKAKIPSNLLRPKSWQDAVNILKKDNIALFSLADTIFLQHLKKHPQAIKVLAWRAQLYLTWADSALLTSYTLVNLNKHAAKSAARKNKNGKQTEKAIEILNKIGIDKLKAVQKMVHILKQNGPDLYETWRVAADYHRLRGEWKQFNLAMFKVEQLNPGSNGLVFLKGGYTLMCLWHLGQ